MAHPANMRAAIRDWLEALMQKHDVSARQLARRGGVAPSTIYRALDKDGEFVTSTSNLAKIAQNMGEELPDVIGGTPPPAKGLSEELIPYDGPALVGMAVAGNDQGVWTVTTHALDLEGYLPGDRVVVDMTVRPQPGDVVCAQVYNFQRGTAETVLRLFQPPFLLTRSTSRRDDDKPLFVDNERVVVRGTVIRMIRERAA